jgi:signal transduction histidine kinase
MNEQIQDNFIATLILCMVLIFLVLIVFFFIIIALYNKKKIKYMLEKQEALHAAKLEIEQSRIEIQEHDLKNISWELHDNIGQLLSVCKMNLSLITEDVSSNNGRIISETNKILSDILTEVRSLSKTLNQDAIRFNGVIKSTRLEVERFNRMNFLKANLTIEGEEFFISEEDEILLFRIIQEIFSNVIKHSKAKNLNILFNFSETNLFIEIKDDGEGLHEGFIKDGLGFRTMSSRAELLQAKLNYENIPLGGLKITIDYPQRQTIPLLATAI